MRWVQTLFIGNAFNIITSCVTLGNIFVLFCLKTIFARVMFYFKGLCHPRRMRALVKSTLKSLAQIFQIPSESSGSCFHLFESPHLRKVS